MMAFIQISGFNKLMTDFPEARPFFIGVLAGSLQKIVTYPLEVRSVMRSVLNESPHNISELGRGLMFSLALSAGKNGCCLELNWKVKRFFSHDSRLSPFIGGATSGAFEAGLNPLVVIKQDIQTGKSRNFIHALKNRHPISYWNGWGSLLGRNMTYSSTMYGSFTLISKKEDDYPLKMLKGGVCSVAATFFSWPWEYVRGQQAKEIKRTCATGLSILKKGFHDQGVKRVYQGSLLAASKQFVQGAILAPFASYVLCDEG